MEKSIISEGKTSTEAIDKGLKILGVSKNDVEITILEEKKKNFFSILDPHVVKVELKVKDEVKLESKKVPVTDESFEKSKSIIENFLKDFLPKISESLKYEIKREDDSLSIEIKGEKAGNLIGYRGETLNSLQVLFSNIISTKIDDSVKVIVDIENYREKRRKTLEDLAFKKEKYVTKTGKKITLEPMTPYERKIIHSALQNSKDVKTYSIGENSNRRVVIAKI